MLISCPECGKQISDKAIACPNCGFPLDNALATQTIDSSEIVQSNGDVLEPNSKNVASVHKTNLASNTLPTIENNSPKFEHKKIEDNEKSKKRTLVYTFLAVAIIILIAILVPPKQERFLKQIDYDLQQIYEEYGMQNVSTEIVFKGAKSYSFSDHPYYNYDITIVCDQFSNLNEEDALSFCRSVDNAGPGLVSNYKYSPFVDIQNATIMCGADIYTFDYDYGKNADQIIYKNGEEYCRMQKTATKPNTSTAKTNSARHTNAEAFTCAQDIVKKKLASPSTAKFCKVTEAEITHLGNGDYMVVGWVDAQNGFGAPVRAEFLVTYTAIKDGNDIGYKNGTALIE